MGFSLPYMLLSVVCVIFIVWAPVTGKNNDTSWYLGCYYGNSLGFADGQYEVLIGQLAGPSVCSKKCLEKGYSIMALSEEMCYCANKSGNFLLNQISNSSVTLDETAHNASSSAANNFNIGNNTDVSASKNCVNRCFDSLCLPHGSELDSLAVYSTLGPYIRNVSVTLVADRVQIGKPFVIEVSGYLASPLEQSVGVQGLNPDNFSLLHLVINWTLGEHSGISVTVLDNGFFTASPVWTFTEPGIHHINASISNLISVEEFSVDIAALIPAPALLEVKVHQTPEQIPSCVTFPVGTDSLERVFLGDRCIFEAFVAMGINLDFYWHFTDDSSTYNSGADCYQQSDCLSNTVNHTFANEGLYKVIVNVSNVYNWIQKVISVAVVPRVLSNLTFDTDSGYAVAVGQNVTLEMELFTTVRQLLILHVTFEAGISHTHQLSDNSPAFQTLNHLQLAESYGRQYCFLHTQVFHQYSTVGSFNISVAVYFDKGVVNATLPKELRVYEPIKNVFPSAFGDQVIPSRVNTTLLINSYADRTGSSVSWNIRKDNYTVVDKTTSDWSLTHAFQDTGFYILQVVASNPISDASFKTELVVQDVISGLSISRLNPECIPSGTLVTVSASVVTGSNITYTWSFNINSSIITDGSQSASYVYSHPGAYLVTVKAENNVSTVLSDGLEFTVQDPVGDFVVDVPDMVTVNHDTTMSFAVLSGTNVTLEVFTNGTLIFNDSSYVNGNPVSMDFVFNQMGPLQVVVRASNRVSSFNSTTITLVVKEIHVVTIETPQQPVLGESIILIARVNGHLWTNGSYIYYWTLPQNQTVTSGSPVISYSCNYTGSQLIGVTVTNLASNASAELLLNISATGAGPRFTHPSTIATGKKAIFSLQGFYSDGDRLLVNFGDGNITTVLYSTTLNNSVNHTYVCAGIYMVKVTSRSGVTVSSLIAVQDPVKGLFLTGPDKLSLAVDQLVPSVVTWTAKVSNGTSYIFHWTFSNGTANGTLIGTDKFSMEVSAPAQLSISVSVENEVSQLSANFATTVQYPILQVTITVARAALGQPSNVVVAVTPAQNYSIDLDLGDGKDLLSFSLEQPPELHCSSVPLCSSTFQFQHVYSAIGVYYLSASVANSVSSATQTADVVVEEPIAGIQLVLMTPSVIRIRDFINATVSVQSGSEITFEWLVSFPYPGSYNPTDRNTHVSSMSFQPEIPGVYLISVRISSPLYSTPFIKGLPSPVKVRSPISNIQATFPFDMSYTKMYLQPDGRYATQVLGFSVHTFSEDVHFLYDFGDGSPVSYVQGSPGFFFGVAASCLHQFTREGTYTISVTAYNEFYNATDVLGPYYVEMLPEGLNLTMNSSVIHKNEVILFNASLTRGTHVTYTWNMGDQTTYVNKGPVVHHQFLTAGVYTVIVNARNRVGSVITNTSVSVLYRLQPVQIYTDKPIYAADTDITFEAVTSETGLLEFVWYFGDKAPVRTTSKSISTRYYTADRYNVIVNASNRLSSFTSDIYPITIQRKVEANRLLSDASVLVNASVAFDCRINSGTNVTYQWSFGDGTYKTGRSTEYHVFDRMGEFTVEVTVSNLVSSVSLTRQIFAVYEPCQPPPVKNMGPLKVQVRRNQDLNLRVTFEADIKCNISQGLLYSWTFFDSNDIPVELPLINTNMQIIYIPNNFLEYGRYTAVARVQIKGNVVYSNYTVPIEVIPTPPICVIDGGNNIFISSRNNSLITLNGEGSFDPDYPESILSFTWDCAPVSGIDSSCFDYNVSTTASTFTIPAFILKSRFDQFQFTLTVQSGDRSSAAEVFVTIQESLLKTINVFCYQCIGNTVNWNEPFSVEAKCETCENILDLSFAWNLYLVNASNEDSTEVPFCKSLDVGGSSSLFIGPSHGGNDQATQAPPITVSPSTYPATSSNAFSVTIASPTSMSPNPANDTGTTTAEQPPPTSNEDPPFPPFLFPVEGPASGGRTRRRRSTSKTITSREGVLSAGSSGSSEGTIFDLIPTPGPPVSVNNSVSSGTVVGGGEGSSAVNQTLGSNNTELTDFDTHYNGIQEGGVASGSFSGGRPPGSDSGISEGGGTASGGTANGGTTGGGSSSGDGSNLVDNSNSVVVPPPATLLDLNRGKIDNGIFKTYTSSGISSFFVTFKPFMLQPRMLYMLEVSAKSNHQILGKSQLFFSTNEVPKGMTCQVQPNRGYEISTDFSIFCTSGKEDLLYQYSFSIGNSSRKLLYEGRDVQYYFNLPAGDPSDGYKVTIYTEISNRFGARTKPCPVRVTVLPSFQRNLSSSYNPDEELYIDGLKNLSRLLLMGSDLEIRNYVILLTNVLNRLSLEPGATVELLTQTRSALIASVCGLQLTHQGALIDKLYMLNDLMEVKEQITFNSAKLVTGHVNDLSQRFQEPFTPDSYFLDEWTVRILVSLLSNAIEVPDNTTEEGIEFIADGIRTTRELLLKFVVFLNHTQFNVNTSLMELQTTQHYSFQNSVESAGSTRFYLPDILNKHITAQTDRNSTCYISQLVFFKQNLYFWGTAPVKINGDVADLSLYNCITRRKINIKGLTEPVNVEFEKTYRNESKSKFSLFRNKMNIHNFDVTSENLMEALQITLDFTRPAEKVFPIMLLLRMLEKPTPSVYNIQQIHSWESNTAQIVLPAGSLKDTGSYYLALLNADYNRTARNKYIASAVNYTITIQWTQCLYWDDIKQWKSDGCSPVQGLSSNKVNCSCNHLTTFTMVNRQISSNYDFTDVSQFISLINNLVPCMVIFFILLIYILLVIACKQADLYSEKKTGSVLLQDNNPSDQQLYSIIIDTGFRSRAGTTAKVHIVLHGEDGVSETRELDCPDKPLFSRNSRHTFILSTPDSLGPLWKVHLWHNNGGQSPSWYVSHVIVKDLVTGMSWFFPAECWLAVDEGDGKVERELTSLSHGPGFKKLLYCKLTEYLEDFHFWASVYSRPSHSQFSHTQRLTLCLILLLGYMLLSTVLIYVKDDEFTAELGLIDISAVSLVTGIFSTLAVLPFGVLLSLLFRFSKVTIKQDTSAEQNKSTKASYVYSVEAHRDALLSEDSTFESYISWQNLQRWAQETWQKKHERGLESRSPIIVSEQDSQSNSKKEGTCASDCSSSGFEDCSSQENSKVPPKCFEHSTSDLRSDSSLDRSLYEHHQVFGSSTIVLPFWCRYLAWAACLLLAIVCIVVTVLLGLKFSGTKSLLWIHSLFFSLLFCIFVVQPLVIFILASVVSLRYKERSDFYTGCLETGPVLEAVKPWSSNGGSENYSHSVHQEQPTDFDRIIAARQRARYLRLVRPPTPAQLKEARDRIRKEGLIQHTLREFVLYIVMLLLLMFVTYGKFSNDQYLLNQAVRTEFTKNPKKLLSEVKTAEDWWSWSMTALLEGLYWDTWYNNASASAKAGPLKGTCSLIGEPMLQKIQVINNTGCTIPSMFTGLITDCVPPYRPEVHDPGSKETSDSQTDTVRVHLCGQIECYDGKVTTVKLGRIRSEAYRTLLQLSADRWLDRSTRAVVVEFTLYNPPSNLFTTVSLLAETPPTGGVIPSAYIESVSIYHVSSVLDYFIMAFELIFLALILLHLYFQVCAMIQKGLLVYWQEPWNWLEVTIIIISLFYYTYYMYHFVLAMEIIDYLQRGNFKAFVDLSLISSWDQLTRCLHGVIIFLLLLKCIRLLRINKVISPCVTMLRLSCSSITLPVVAGIIFMIAYSCLGNLLFLSTSHPFSTIVRSFQTVLMHFMGVSELQTLSSMYKTNQLSIAIYYGTFFFILSVLWIGMIAGVLTSLAQDSKKSSRSKHLVTLTEVVIYTREKFLAFIGRKRQNSPDSPTTGGSNFYLDEFETLMDELLFRLNAFSNSLHRSLPAKQRNYLGDESPLISQSDYYYSPGSESASVNEDSVGKKVYKIEQKLFKNNPEMYNLLMSTKENDLASQRPLRSQLETETFHHLHLKNHGSPSATSVDNSENCKSSHTHSQDKPSVTLPGSTNPSSESCASMSDSCSLPEQCSTCQTNCAVNPDHYNLAKLGDDLPHVLCGTKCPEKLAAQSIESRTSHQQRSTSASLSSRSRKPLKRSHTTIIKPLECPIEVTGSGAGNNDEDGDVSEEKTSISAKETMDQPTKLSSPERSSQHSNTKGQRSGPKVQEGSNMKKDKQKKPKKADCHFLIPEDVQDSDLQNELPVLPESLRQCW
ncbi:polycystin-1-like protein 1 isoform X2 [Acipenser ruthenus]|uniref:polycystin-1-like protein 1 isoform X2 n=1 Tax=Acipenser ruthenus TaxID=7906 RepID=UPI0027428585|nr:polycystin-1-like protein 1 isoform X2 [Acipenser ruthenus]